MSEGNVSDLSTGLKAIDLVPETNAVGTESMPETPKITPAAAITYDTRFITHWMKTFMPTGYEVVVDLPYLPDGKTALFLIKCSPLVPPLVPVENEWWVYQKNQYQFVRHDLHKSDDLLNPFIGALPPGIFINQVHDNNPLAIYAWHNRMWCGGLNFHIRVDASFGDPGYLRYTKLKNVAIQNGVYDRYSHGPIPQKLGTFMQSGHFNSYTRSDMSMFRHTEVTIPYERVTPHDNFNDQLVMYNALAQIDNYYDFGLNQWTVPVEQTTVNTSSYDDYIAVEAVGGLAAARQQGQVRFIIEMAAGEDFECFNPLPIGNGFFDPFSRYFNATGAIQPGPVHGSAMKIPDTLPDPTLTSNGQNSITAV